MPTVPSTCFPVTHTVSFRGKEICQQDLSKPTPLTEITKGTVSCELFQNGKCEGKTPCVVKEAYPEITMVSQE